jgi:hypothetical protein
MKISGYTPASGVKGRSVKKRDGEGGGGFNVASGDRAAASAGSGAAASISGIGALLALQEVDDPLVGRRKAVARGNDLLDGMESLKADLLGGRVSAERLDRIVGMLSKRADSGDPQLEGVIDEIELRAKVELAKLGRFDA